MVRSGIVGARSHIHRGRLVIEDGDSRKKRCRFLIYHTAPFLHTMTSVHRAPVHWFVRMDHVVRVSFVRLSRILWGSRRFFDLQALVHVIIPNVPAVCRSILIVIRTKGRWNHCLRSSQARYMPYATVEHNGSKLELVPLEHSCISP